jgi:hypothetical protein
MAHERRSVDADDLQGPAELLRIIEELRQGRESAIITSAGEDIAIIRPLRRAKQRSSPPRKTGIVSRDDPLWSIVGMADSSGPGDVARNKHRYLADAYAHKHE